MALEEPVGIIPRIDLVFRTLMDDPVILLDFLNAVIVPRVPIVSVQILNSDVRDLLGERSAIVDVKAMDAQGRVYQIEMQTWNHAGLQKRILFDWAALYRSLIKAGDTNYHLLRPVISIWLLNQNLFPNAAQYHHHFAVMDTRGQTVLSQDF